MRLVLDASVSIAWLAPDEESAYASAVLGSLGTDPPVVPTLWHWEMLNALRSLERHARIANASATFAAFMRRRPVRLDAAPTESRGLSELVLAQRHQLTVYDAAYLALAKDSGLPLATLDAQLAKAAQAEGVFFSP